MSRKAELSAFLFCNAKETPAPVARHHRCCHMVVVNWFRLRLFNGPIAHAAEHDHLDRLSVISPPVH